METSQAFHLTSHTHSHINIKTLHLMLDPEIVENFQKNRLKTKKINKIKQFL